MVHLQGMKRGRFVLGNAPCNPDPNLYSTHGIFSDPFHEKDRDNSSDVPEWVFDFIILSLVHP